MIEKIKNNKKKFFFNLLLIFSLVYFGVLSLYSAELMTSATQLGTKRVHAEVYYRFLSKQDLNLSIGSGGQVVVNKSTIATSSSVDLESEGSGNGVMAKLTFQPFDFGIRYYVMGGLSTYDLSIPSGSFSNTYATDRPGSVFGGGLKYTLVPYTMVTPALSADLSATHSRYRLTKFAAGDGGLISDTDYLLTVFELQAALTISKKIMFKLGDNRASFDPYLGVKVIRTRTNLDENFTGGHFSGTRVGVAPFFGFKFKPFPYEGLIIEGSLLSEVSASIGLTLGF